MRTVREEYDRLREELEKIGNFFPWDVHPNKVRAANIRYTKILRKMAVLFDSEEYRW